MSKVEKYGWEVVDRRGRFRLIAKGDLHIDHDYQRTKVSWTRVAAMAAEWSWAACLTLGVTTRPDGTHWVFDGQHRKLAADKRADIDDLPCMVFPSTGVVDEAASFLRVNVGRKGVPMIEKFRSMVTANDPAAVRVRDMVEASGYEVRSAGERTVSCVGALMRAVARDEAVAQLAWDLAVELYAGQPVIDRVFDGLFYLETLLGRKGAGSLAEPHNRAALVRLGADRIARCAADVAQAYGGGAKSAAEAIARELNKGRRSRQIPYPYSSAD